MRTVRTVVAVLALGTAAVLATAGPAAACHDSTIEIWVDHDTCVGIRLENGSR